eukprot:TRINITY_DN5690_c0_g1_i1.p1 TRINITY_DN5690_c0_g1~~TRINITY_DN5690_c0_g1_i1.p1  ORF type:complete len:317 (+),score=42.23 TRINITY_DN5690_c0_g1_i1:48-953(+)
MALRSRACLAQRRQRLAGFLALGLSSACIVAPLGVTYLHTARFPFGGRRWGAAGASAHHRYALQAVAPELASVGAVPPGFGAPSQWSLAVGFVLFLVGLPGVIGTIQRSGQAKFVEKTYVMPGTAAGGLEMRSIAGGLAAYFRNLNYVMQDSPQQGRIRFVGQLQGSMSQAGYLTLIAAVAIGSTAILLQAVFPDGVFDLGPDAFFAPVILSPGAGWYYWGKAFRKDIVELSLGTSDDATETTLIALGNLETIELLQAGVRFANQEGKLFRLLEPGTEYQPGIFESNAGVKVIREGIPSSS